MKKINKLLFVVPLSLVLFSCGKKKTTTKESTTVKPTTVAPTTTIKTTTKATTTVDNTPKISEELYNKFFNVKTIDEFNSLNFKLTIEDTPNNGTAYTFTMEFDSSKVFTSYNNEEKMYMDYIKKDEDNSEIEEHYNFGGEWYHGGTYSWSIDTIKAYLRLPNLDYDKIGYDKTKEAFVYDGQVLVETTYPKSNPEEAPDYHLIYFSGIEIKVTDDKIDYIQYRRVDKYYENGSLNRVEDDTYKITISQIGSTEVNGMIY